jgi:transposase-like protein
MRKRNKLRYEQFPLSLVDFYRKRTAAFKEHLDAFSVMNAFDIFLKVIYTTSAIESINKILRKIVKDRSSFPTDEAALKLLYPALNNFRRKWTMPIRNWRAALNRFAILFEERMPFL